MFPLKVDHTCISKVFFVSLLVLFQLLIYTFRYHLSIVDISPMSGQMILTVQQAHHLRAWRKLRPKIIMANTGAPQFDEAERLYEVGSWGNWDSKAGLLLCCLMFFVSKGEEEERMKIPFGCFPESCTCGSEGPSHACLQYDNQVRCD